MIWYIGIAIILLGYIAFYWRRGITHPIPITLAYWVVMLPLKYFLFRAMNIPFIFGASIYDAGLGGLYIFSFLLVTTLCHYFCNRVQVGIPLVEAVPRIQFWVPAIALIFLIIALFIGMYGAGALANSLKIRAFVSTGFVAYLELVMEFCMLAALVQLAERQGKIPLVLFLAMSAAYFILMARTGLLVVLLTSLLAYLCMVRRIVPAASLFVMAALLAPLALVQGILRQRGGYTRAGFDLMLNHIDPETGGRFLAAAFGSRVSQLDTFAVFARRIQDGTIQTDPLEPIYVFSQAVPRSLWPDKPRMFADYATGLIAPRVHDIGTVINFIGPAEMMYAYGIVLGIVLSGLICGYLFAMADRYYFFCRGRPFAFVFFCLLPFMFLGSATQSGFFNSVAMLLAIFYGALLILLFRFRVHPALGRPSTSAAFGAGSSISPRKFGGVEEDQKGLG